MDTSTSKEQILKEVPERFGTGPKRLSLQYLIKHADRVTELSIPGGKSIFKAYFDDGVGRGEFVFKFKQADLTPLHVYSTLAATGWPGFSISWLEGHCAERMAAAV